MTHSPDAVDIQTLDRTDATLISRIVNASMPEDAWITEEEVQLRREIELPDEPAQWLVARSEDRAVALGTAGRNIFTPPGRYFIGIVVIPEFRRRHIAARLYERLVPIAVERGAVALRTDIHEHYLPIAGPWLEREGYREIERMRPSELDLQTVEFDKWNHAIRRVEEEGLTLTTLAEEDTKENRHRLWELNEASRGDVPHTGPTETLPFEKFDELLDKPASLLDCLVIAKDGDRFVGHTLLVHQNAEKALTGMTGVDREYRNRGIALALKVRCAELARGAGYKRMTTFNHVNNPSMLAVNDKLGYRPLPHEILFEKLLR